MKLLVLLSVGIAAAMVSPSSVPAATVAITGPEHAKKKSACTTFSVKLQQDNNNMTSTLWLTTHTKERLYDCHGCHHITTSWIGWRPLFHHQPTTVTVKKTTTYVALCSGSPGPVPTQAPPWPERPPLENDVPGMNDPENVTQGVDIPEVKTRAVDTQDIDIEDIDIQDIDIQDIDTLEHEVEEFEVPEGVVMSIV